MKQKLIALVGAVCIAFAGVQAYAVDEYGTMSAKEKKQKQKDAAKDAKTDAKELKKAGWILNGSGSLEYTIQQHLLMTEKYGGPYAPKVGNAENVKTISFGKTRAFMDAAKDYARLQRMALKDQIDGMAGEVNGEQTDDMVDRFEARVAQEIKGVLKESYMLTRKLSNGHYDVQVYYLIDEKNSSWAKKQALQDALEQSDIMGDWADKISKSLDW